MRGQRQRRVAIPETGRLGGYENALGRRRNRETFVLNPHGHRRIQCHFDRDGLAGFEPVQVGLDPVWGENGRVPRPDNNDVPVLWGRFHWISVPSECPGKLPGMWMGCVDLGGSHRALGPRWVFQYVPHPTTCSTVADILEILASNCPTPISRATATRWLPSIKDRAAVLAQRQEATAPPALPVARPKSRADARSPGSRRAASRSLRPRALPRLPLGARPSSPPGQGASCRAAVDSPRCRARPPPLTRSASRLATGAGE